MCSAAGYSVAERPAYNGREIGYPAIVPSLAVTGCNGGGIAGQSGGATQAWSWCRRLN
jgi:hypothetical protein